MSQAITNKLIHDLSSPLSILLFSADELPDHAAQSANKMRRMIDFFRLIQKDSIETQEVINFLQKIEKVTVSATLFTSPIITLAIAYELTKTKDISLTITENEIISDELMPNINISESEYWDYIQKKSPGHDFSQGKEGIRISVK